MEPSISFFDASEADYEALRVSGGGAQAVCEWVTPADGRHNSIGVAELRNIRLVDYRFGFSDFLFVIGGDVTVSQNGGSRRLTPGQGVLIPQGAVVTIGVRDWLRWLYVTDPGNWRDLMGQPGRVEAIGDG